MRYSIASEEGSNRREGPSNILECFHTSPPSKKELKERPSRAEWYPNNDSAGLLNISFIEIESSSLGANLLWCIQCSFWLITSDCRFSHTTYLSYFMIIDVRAPTKRQNDLYSVVWKLFPTGVPALLPCALLPWKAGELTKPVHKTFCAAHFVS